MSLSENDKILADLVALNADTSDCVPLLHAVALLKKPSHILELGVREGVSTIALLVACRKLSSSLISLDIDPCLKAHAKITDLHLRDYWIFIQADDRELLHLWNYGKVGMIFLDTDHDLTHSAQELEICDKVLKKGGVILIHDTFAPTYADINKAITLFVEKRKKTYERQELGTRYGLTMLIKK